MPRKAKTASNALPPALRTPIAIHDPQGPSVLEQGAPNFAPPGHPDALFLKANAHIPGEWLEKMLLLLDHYRIDRDDPERWFALAFSLAMDHVEGMKIAQKPKDPGAPREWGELKLARLYFEIDDIRRESGLSISDSCEEILGDHNRWKHYPKCTRATLVRRYHEAQSDPFIKMLNRIAESKGHAGRQIILLFLNEELTTPASHTG
jgi:hypothetical protein